MLPPVPMVAPPLYSLTAVVAYCVQGYFECIDRHHIEDITCSRYLSFPPFYLLFNFDHLDRWEGGRVGSNNSYLLRS